MIKINITTRKLNNSPLKPGDKVTVIRAIDYEDAIINKKTFLENIRNKNILDLDIEVYINN